MKQNTQNTQNTEKLVTINSQSKNFMYKTFSSTNAVAWTINPVDMKTVKRDYFISGNVNDGVNTEGMTDEQAKQFTLDYIRGLIQKNEDINKCMVVKVEGYTVKNSARAETLEDFTKNSIELVYDEQGRPCLPSDYKAQLEELHAPTIKLIKDSEGNWKLPDNVQDIVNSMNKKQA